MGSLTQTKKYNNIKTGIILGTVFPLLLLLIIFIIKKNDYSFIEYVNINFLIGNLPKVISLTLIPNLIFFYIFLQKNYLKSARGVLMSMFIVGFVIVILKFL